MKRKVWDGAKGSLYTYHICIADSLRVLHLVNGIV